MHNKEKVRREFERAMPRIRTHAEIVFRSVKCSHKKADLISEVIAIAWKWWRRLRQRRKNPNRFVSALATYAAKAVKSGRRLCGQEKPKDVLSPRAQCLKGFALCSLPLFTTLTATPLSEALADNTRTPVDEQVAFRLDFPAWMASYDECKRRIIEAMAQGERTQDLATMFKVSEARISQMRREFCIAWIVFTDEEC